MAHPLFKTLGQQRRFVRITQCLLIFIAKVFMELNQNDRMSSPRKQGDRILKTVMRSVESTPSLPSPTLATRVTDFLFTDEKTQKFTLTAIAFLSMVFLTWYLKTYPAPPIGLRANMNNILWLSAIYFYYQVFSLALNPRHAIAKKGPLPSYQFFVEFIKFFLALTSTFFYTQFIFGQGNIFDSLRIYGYGSFVLMYSLISLLAAIVFYRFQLLKSLALQSRVAQAEAQLS